MTERMYGELATWWPLISPPEDYRSEAAYFASLLSTWRRPVRTVLELGSGGGHNAFHLKERFDLTLVDLAPEMLKVSEALNPECTHIVGDMRSIRLDRRFDAVFVHDAIMYMTTTDDLVAAMRTAAAHCEPGGLAVFAPDETRETFTSSTDWGGGDGDDGRAARFLEWTWDPDPADTWVHTDYVFVLREPDGSVQVEHDRHTTGLFAEAEWLAALASAGFEAWSVLEETGEDRHPRTIFLATPRP